MDFNNLLKVFVRAMLNTDKKCYTEASEAQENTGTITTYKLTMTQQIELRLLKDVWLKQKRM